MAGSAKVWSRVSTRQTYSQLDIGHSLNLTPLHFLMKYKDIASCGTEGLSAPYQQVQRCWRVLHQLESEEGKSQN